MDSAIIVAVITGGLSFAGVIVSNLMASKKTEQTMAVNQAVIDTKLENLTQEVRTHNGFAVEIPVIKEQIKVINKRIKDLEDKGGN